MNKLYARDYEEIAEGLVIENGDVLFSFVYIRPEIGGNYNIFDHPEYFSLKIMKESLTSGKEDEME